MHILNNGQYNEILINYARIRQLITMYYIIGVDLDNTIVSYDNLIYKTALERSLVNKNINKSKKLIRDTIRKLPNGEIKWKELQAIVYGQRMKEARLITGVRRFFELCHKNKVKVNIISHKTEFSSYDKTKTNLRSAAIEWMERNKFFKDDGLSLSKNSVYFESTREDKIKRIKQLKCTHFIDDLEETFMENSFPKNIKKILYAPHGAYLNLKNVLVFKTWEGINEYFFKSK